MSYRDFFGVCSIFFVPWLALNDRNAGGSEWMVVKDAMQEGLELLERELVVFENVLKDKHLL